MLTMVKRKKAQASKSLVMPYYFIIGPLNKKQGTRNKKIGKNNLLNINENLLESYRSGMQPCSSVTEKNYHSANATR